MDLEELRRWGDSAVETVAESGDYWEVSVGDTQWVASASPAEDKTTKGVVA